VLSFLGSLLSAAGVLVCTTPNAACLANRVQMLSGRNPCELLRLYDRNPGHIREYTRDELISIAEQVGLDCISHSYDDWLKREKSNAIKSAALRILNLYPAFRRFQTFVFFRQFRPSPSVLRGVRPKRL
jgi:hypothetical protein